MYTLISFFLDICLLRKGPQDLPSSWDLLKLSLVAYGLSGLAFVAVDLGLSIAILETLLDMGMLMGLCYGVLVSAGYKMRFVQTMTALAGTGTLLTLIALPVAIWMGQEVSAGEGTGLPLLLFWVLVFWSLAVIAHILRHALSVDWWIGLLYALGYFIISLFIRSLLFSGV